MAKIPYQDPLSNEVQSPLLAGTIEGLSKVSETVGMDTEVITDSPLVPIPGLDESDPYRIYQCLDGNRIWLSSPAPVIKLNGNVMSVSQYHYSIDYIGGSITFIGDYRPSPSDVITATFSKIVVGSTITERVDNIIVSGTPTEGNTELIDIRTAYKGKVYPTAGEAVRKQIEEVSNELEILNLGGLNLKEDFIGQQVNEWLDEHPEATTTVQDGSIEEIKFTDELRKRKASYYNSVIELKSDNSLKEGMTCVTLGYNYAGDGGSATYSIVSDGEKDNIFYIGLDNGLIASLITGNQVNLYQLGCTKDTDSSVAITKALEKNLTVIVPKGNWLCNPLVLPSGAVIKGENVNYEVETNDSNLHNNLSILQCNIDCETFIDCSNSDHITLEVCLASCLGKSDYLNAKNITNFVKLNGCCYSTFDLMILCLNNNGLVISKSWENTFKRLYFRGILNPNVTDIKCDLSEEGISQSIFYDIQSEGFGACVLDIENGLFYHNKIESVLVELSPYEPFERVSDTAGNKLPLFKLGNGSNNIIGSIQINNLSLDNAKFEDTVYEHSIFNVTVHDSVFGILVNSLVFDTGVNNDIQLLTQTGNPGFLSSYLIVESIVSPTQKLIRTNMESMNYFKIGSIYKRTNEGLTRMNAINSITDWFQPSDNSKAVLVSDSTNFNAMNFENAVVKIPTDFTKVANIKVKTNDTIHIMYKGTDVEYEIKLLQRNNSVLETLTGTLPSRNSYSVQSLQEITQSGVFIASISFKSPSGTGYIGDIF